MREDMARVIVERPRIKAWNVRKGRPQALEELPAREGMRRAHALRGDRKQLNENLAPLRRYLESQVGRPWDKVYSEIARNLRVDNTVQQHVRDHLKDFVAIEPRRTNGWRKCTSGLWWQPLYVDPRTGLLCRTDRLPEEKAVRRAERDCRPAAVERISLDGELELRMVEGIWYEIRLAPLPIPAYRAFREIRKVPRKRFDLKSGFLELEMEVRRLTTPAVSDVVTGLLLAAGPEVDDPESWSTYRRTQPDRFYAVAKRTLSRRQLRQHGLSNLYP